MIFHRYINFTVFLLIVAPDLIVDGDAW